MPRPVKSATIEPPAAAPRLEAPLEAEEARAARLLRLADALRPTAIRLSRRLFREANRVGASALDAQLLFTITAHEGVGVSELAAMERMSAPTMSAHVKRLEALGWIARAADGVVRDRRRAPLFLTAAGRAAHERIRRSRTDWLAARLERLTEAELNALEIALPGLARLYEGDL